MPKALRTCLTLSFLLILGSAICVGVWAGGIYLFGLPGAIDTLGEPAPDLSRMQEIGLGMYLLVRQNDLTSPAGNPGAALDLTVVPGQTASHVIDALAEAEIVRNPEILRLYLRYRGLDRGIEAGNYNLNGNMTILELASSLQSASVEADVITIPEGWRREQIASYLASALPGFSAQEFLNATAAIPAAYSISPSMTNLEGFLFPETYHLDPSGTVDDLVEQDAGNFRRTCQR